MRKYARQLLIFCVLVSFVALALPVTSTAKVEVSVPATVTVTEGPTAQHRPVVVDDSYSVDAAQTLNVCAPGVLENDSDPDSDTIIAVLVSDVSHGTLTLNADGSFAYDADCGFTGTDSFTYKASDGTLDSTIATVTITVGPRPPVEPITEIATGVLCVIGLAGVGGFFLLRRHRKNQTAR